VLLTCPSIAAHAETCKYVDSDGHVIYSNTPNNPPKNAKKEKCFADPGPRPAPAQPAAAAAAKPKAEGGNFPKVDGETQKKRDDDRRRILEDELAGEQQRLEAARQALAEQEATRSGDERNYQRFLDRVQPYRNTVATHERNVDAIKREISNLR
jgi:hypothetical protein